MENGNIYLINYGSFSKVATFLRSEDGNNEFFDMNGKFILTDSFLSKGTVKIETIEN
ncbi:hypothetical protein [Paenibacillus donghaensis]|uniref:hypothetical protein n=1 Tax=Paenibacillus donghaensis TaxID=414771 RepID=UPI0012FE7582|nr:hypothetical protein [Paenibacillus donghaensis]